MNSQAVNAQAMHIAMVAMTIMPIIGVIFLVITIIPYWMIWKKAGFSPWLSLLLVIPLVNLAMLYVLAFSEWKVTPVNRGIYPNA